MHLQDKSHRTRPYLFLLAGILGGAAAGYPVDRCEYYFRPSEEIMRKLPPIGQEIPPETLSLVQAEKRHTIARNTGLAVGMVGAVTGLLLAIAAGWNRRSILVALRIGVGSAMGGAAAGWFGGYTEVLLDHWVAEKELLEGSIRAMASQAFAWGIMGLGIAFGFALTVLQGRERYAMLISCAAAGLIAGTLFSPLAAFVFPTEKSELPVPTGLMNRFFWSMLAGGLIGLACGRSFPTTPCPTQSTTS